MDIYAGRTASVVAHRLALADAVWAALALGYDLPKLVFVPLWAWPFVAICPLFPALLAGVWTLPERRRATSLLTALAALPSAVYGLVSLVYYPLYLTYWGFDWVVASRSPGFFYAAQGWWLLRRYPLKRGMLTALLWLLGSWFVHWRFSSFGFFDWTFLDAPSYNLFFAGAAAISLLTVVLKKRLIQYAQKVN